MIYETHTHTHIYIYTHVYIAIFLITFTHATHTHTYYICNYVLLVFTYDLIPILVANTTAVLRA